jgi:hypothetical protein
LIFELMSNGSITNLTRTGLPEGIPEIPGPGVVLLLPYNRYLLGHSFMRNYERWIWGKPGSEPEEVFLYENSPQTFSLDDSARISLSPGVVSQIRGALLSQMPPPGEHLPTVLILRSTLKDHPLFGDDALLQNEAAFLQHIEKDENINMTYWGVRFALFRGEFEAVARIKTWLKTAPDAFDVQERDRSPKVCFSLTPLPDGKELAALEALSFSVDDLQRMVSQSALPVVLFSKAGYLVLSDFGSSGGAAFRVWMFMPSPLWNDLREHRKLSIRDLVLSAWGFCDGVQSAAERARYAQSFESCVQTV